jgi:hypothetical protein
MDDKQADEKEEVELEDVADGREANRALRPEVQAQLKLLGCFSFLQAVYVSFNPKVLTIYST